MTKKTIHKSKPKAGKVSAKANPVVADDVAVLLGGKRKIVIGLRTCGLERLSHGGFKWPESGWAEAPDWNSRPECGGGLHFLRNGIGESSLLDWGDAIWQAVIAYEDETVDIGSDKSKAKRCFVAVSGSRGEAARFVYENTNGKFAVHGVTATAGYKGTATAGDEGILTFKYWDEKAQRARIHVAYVGEDGIEPKKPYRLVDGKVVSAD